MKRFILLMCVCFLPSILFGQITQKGVVSELSSGNKPIPGVALIASDAPPTDSDNKGHFKLTFQNIKPGSPILVKELYKKGYELVNDVDVREWVFSSNHIFKIVMCKEGFLAESKRKFYKIGNDYYKAAYQKSLKELKRQKALNEISDTEYAAKIREANDALTNKRAQLEYYAEKFSKINKDDLSELDKKALELLEQGQVDAAIKVYEDEKILEKFLMRLATRDTANYNLTAIAPLLNHEVELLLQKNDQNNHQKAERILRALAQSDTLNFNYAYRYACFLKDDLRAKDAFNWFKTSARSAKSEDEKELVIKSLKKLDVIIQEDQLRNEIKETINTLTQ